MQKKTTILTDREKAIKHLQERWLQKQTIKPAHGPDKKAIPGKTDFTIPSFKK